jgi:hypothetical protein
MLDGQIALRPLISTLLHFLQLITAYLDIEGPSKLHHNSIEHARNRGRGRVARHVYLGKALARQKGYQFHLRSQYAPKQ